jgi:hypothetical protein
MRRLTLATIVAAGLVFGAGDRLAAREVPVLSETARAQLARLEQGWRFATWRVEMATAERARAEAALGAFLNSHRVDGYVLWADGAYRPAPATPRGPDSDTNPSNPGKTAP